jgi:hypothetical protein
MEVPMTPNNLAAAATVLLGLLGLIVTVILAVKADRTAQQRRLEAVIQTMVVEKFEVAFREIAKHEDRLTLSERRHERLLGRLEGRGILRHNEDDLEGAGS